MKQALVVVWVLLLAACTTLGLESPNTTPQRLAYGYTTLAQVRDNTTHLLEVKRLDVDTARHVQGYADIARDFLDQAKAAHFKGDETQAVKLLNSAESLLTQMQDLVAKEQKRP